MKRRMKKKRLRRRRRSNERRVERADRVQEELKMKGGSWPGVPMVSEVEVTCTTSDGLNLLNDVVMWTLKEFQSRGE
jgi:hypothetical protein